MLVFVVILPDVLEPVTMELVSYSVDTYFEDYNNSSTLSFYIHVLLLFTSRGVSMPTVSTTSFGVDLRPG